MRIFLTGATGMIGSAVGESLARHGHRVVALARSDAAAARLSASGYEIVRGDLGDLEILRGATGAADAVVHTGFTWMENARAVESGAVGAFVEALRGTGKTLVTTSGAGVLGDTGDEPADEARPAPQPRPWRCDLEDLVLNAEGLRGVVVRPSLVYDAETHPIVRVLIERSRRVGAGVHVGNGQSRWSTVHAHDLADLYALAVSDGAATGILHGASSFTSMKSLAQAIARGLGYGGATTSWDVAEALVETPYAQALCHNILVSSARALDLQWAPSRPALSQIVTDYCRRLNSRGNS